MSTYQQRGYTVEVGFAIGRVPDGPVDPNTFRHTREEAAKELRELEQWEREFQEFDIKRDDLKDDSDDPLFPRDLRFRDEEPPRRGVVGSVRVSGRRTEYPRVMSRREWRIMLADRIY